MFFHETEGLGTTEDGMLYAGRTRLGHVEDCADEAEGLGLGGEYAEHLDIWLDAKSCDYAGQVSSDYRSQQGY